MKAIESELYKVYINRCTVRKTFFPGVNPKECLQKTAPAGKRRVKPLQKTLVVAYWMH